MSGQETIGDYLIDWKLAGDHWMDFTVREMRLPPDDYVPLINGFIKWDGCSEWHYEDEEFLHLCGPRGVDAWTQLMRQVYRIALEHMPAFDYEKSDLWPEAME